MVRGCSSSFNPPRSWRSLEFRRLASAVVDDLFEENNGECHFVRCMETLSALKHMEASFSPQKPVPIEHIRGELLEPNRLRLCSHKRSSESLEDVLKRTPWDGLLEKGHPDIELTSIRLKKYCLLLILRLSLAETTVQVDRSQTYLASPL